MLECVLLQSVAAAQTRNGPALCPTTLTNIYVNESLQSAFGDVLQKSRTFRQQCGTIAAARHVHVTVRVTAAPTSTFTRAQTTVRRYSSGLIMAFVEIPVGYDHVELLAHEFEHIVEQIEGINLQQLVDSGSTAVTMIAKGVFEMASIAHL